MPARCWRKAEDVFGPNTVLPEKDVVRIMNVFPAGVVSDDDLMGLKKAVRASLDMREPSMSRA